ncbi:MAG: hypothetical protein QOE29_908 [Gaiellaceae bacterium]|nr:hypothetical protein [Gaiellaceae bacterium]
MTGQAIAGIVGLNLLFLLAGGAATWAALGCETWGAIARLAGVAYLVGVALGGTAWTLLLVAGVPLGGAAMVGTLPALALLGLVAGLLLHRPAPRWPGRLPALSALDLVGLAVVGIVLEALFRAGRLTGLYTFDAWAFWVPKGEAIYYFHGLDHQLFSTLPGPTYPPLLPALEAADFHAMAGVDTVTLHLQFWCLAAGFVVAVVGLLAGRAPRWLVWPAAVLAVAAPRMTEALLAPQADFLLDFFVAIGALLLVLWVLDEDTRWLALAAPLLVGAVLTKREGALLVACLLVAAALASGARLRRSWRPLAVVVVAIGGASLAWHAWYGARGIGGEVAPGAGFAGGLDLGRAASALRLSLRVLLDVGRWSFIPWIGLGALLVAALARRRRLVVFVGVAAGLAVLGGAWVTWSFRELAVTSQESLNPIVRYTASIELLLAVTTPLLLGAALRDRLPRPRQVLAPLPGLGLVAAALLVYPAVTLAGGLPRFPSRSDCVRPPVAGQPVAIVFGHFDRLEPAQKLLARAESVGFKGFRIEPDGCGRLVLWLPNGPSVEVGQSVVGEARGARIEAHLELGHG